MDLVQVCYVEGNVCRSVVVDYFITDRQTKKFILEMDIDEEKIICPFHKTKRKGSEKLVYSDHNPITSKLSISQNKTSTEKTTKWIIPSRRKKKKKKRRKQSFLVSEYTRREPGSHIMFQPGTLFGHLVFYKQFFF